MPLGCLCRIQKRERADARYFVQPGSQNRGPWQPSPSSLVLPGNPAIPVKSSTPEKESRPAQEVNMSSLYLRGSTYCAKSLENGRVARWSLKTASRT